MLRILKQTNMEQPILVDIERHNHALLLGLDVINVFYVQRKGLSIVDSLQGVTLFIQFYTGEEGGVCSYSGLYSLAKPFFVQTSVKHI